MKAWCGISCAALLIGCEQPLRPIFREIMPPIVWPAPPDAPRVRYVGALAGEEDLGRPEPFGVLQALLAGPTPKVGFSTPTSIAVAGDRVFVADGQGQAVYVMDLQTREFQTIGRGPSRALQWPADLALIADRIAVADSMGKVVQVFAPDGRLVETIGAGSLERPCAVALDDVSGELWVVDSAQHACVVFDRQGREVRRVGRRGEGPGEFNFPAGITFDHRLGVIVADSMNFRVQRLSPGGEAVAAFGQKGNGAGDFALPRDVAVDRASHIYVLDSQFENIQVFDASGQLLMAWGEEGRAPGQFYLPSGLFIDGRDRIWVADSYNRRLQVFQYLPEAES
jgi:DNA-binding beta-propeller fold protein YncE